MGVPRTSNNVMHFSATKNALFEGLLLHDKKPGKPEVLLNRAEKENIGPV